MRFAYYVLIASPEILGPQAATSLRQIFPAPRASDLGFFFLEGVQGLGSGVLGFRVLFWGFLSLIIVQDTTEPYSNS